MSEFKDKVEQYKQTIVEPGFTVDGESGITDSPTISGESIDLVPQESPEINENEQEQKHKKHSGKTVSSLKRRLEQATFERNVREAQTQELLAKVQEQEQRLATQQALLEKNEQYKNAYYENNLQTRENAILNELKIAKEEGDVDKEIALSKELAKVAADQSTYGLYKSQLKNKSNQNSYTDRRDFYPQTNYGNEFQHQNDYEDPINEAYDSWLERNEWADPESRNYSPRLRDEANQLANELDEMLRYNGDADIIGTPKYFESIDNLMAERYSVQKNRSQESQYSGVAPVSRNGSSMADQYMTKNPNNTRRHTPLTEEEYKIARNLQIKLPNGKWATGDEAIRRYAEYKRLNNPNGSQKIVID